MTAKLSNQPSNTQTNSQIFKSTVDYSNLHSNNQIIPMFKSSHPINSLGLKADELNPETKHLSALIQLLTTSRYKISDERTAHNAAT